MNNNKHKSHKISLAWIEPDSTRKKYYDYIKSPSEPEDHTEEEQMEEMAFIEEARIVSKVNFIFNSWIEKYSISIYLNCDSYSISCVKESYWKDIGLPSVI